jgi:hypothetical protein
MTRFRVASFVAALFLLAAAKPSERSAAGDALAVTNCHEVFALISGVSRAQARKYVPPEYSLVDPESTPDEDAEVVLRAAQCDLANRPTRFAEVRITINQPEHGDADAFHWYLVSWATDNRALRQWARTGTGVDGAVSYSDRLRFGFAPEPLLFVDAPEPAAWAFMIEALAPKGTGEPGVPAPANLWRETGAGTVRFTRRPDAAQLAVAIGRVGTPCGSELAALLGLTAPCEAEETVWVESRRVLLLSNTTKSETHTKEVFR